MQFPGLSSNENQDDKTKVELEAGSEWRFEVDFDAKSPLVVKLLSGTAEMFGTELSIGSELTFKGTKGAIYTWHGCELEYSGNNPSEYTSDETPMSIYANLHFALENLRQQKQPPVTLVLGPPNSGKSSLCKILSSYASKGGLNYPMLVNIDPSEGVFSPPGGLSAAPISDILDVEEGWGLSQLNGPAVLHPKNPLVYFYGLETVSANPAYYKHVISRLALGVKARLDNDAKVRGSGVIIDSPAELTKDDALISSVVSDFAVDTIVVVGHERLYSDISKRFKSRQKKITVLKVPKSGGCVDRDDAYMRQIQKQSIHDYFYGTLRQPLAPYTVTVDYSVPTVYRVAEEENVDKSVLPGGIDEDNPLQNNADKEKNMLVKLDVSAILQNCVMAVLNSSPNDPPEVLTQCEVLGFVHVVEANDDRRKMKVLMPVPGRLPTRPFVIGHYRYHE